MVTFSCEKCDAVLKKKQCGSHVANRCRPAALTCIDCHKTFYGSEYEAHISCLTEQEKHWGQYAKPKHITQPKIVEKEPEPVQEKLTTEDWRGWRSEIKTLLANVQGQINLERMLDRLNSKILAAYPEEKPLNESQFLGKIRQIKKSSIRVVITNK